MISSSATVMDVASLDIVGLSIPTFIENIFANPMGSRVPSGATTAETPVAPPAVAMDVDASVEGGGEATVRLTEVHDLLYCSAQRTVRSSVSAYQHSASPHCPRRRR